MGRERPCLGRRSRRAQRRRPKTCTRRAKVTVVISINLSPQRRCKSTALNKNEAEAPNKIRRDPCCCCRLGRCPFIRWYSHEYCYWSQFSGLVPHLGQASSDSAPSRISCITLHFLGDDLLNGLFVDIEAAALSHIEWT